MDSARTRVFALPRRARSGGVEGAALMKPTACNKRQLQVRVAASEGALALVMKINETIA